MQMNEMFFIFSYKGNLIFLFFTRSKFNYTSRIVASSLLRNILEERGLF